MTTLTNDSYWREYTSKNAISTYSRGTAGFGIGYLLDHDYKNIYLDALNSLPPKMREKEIRILEFGCGAGMNLLHLASVLNRQGISFSAIGTDFSPVLIDAARREANGLRGFQFHIAKNEQLIKDLSAALRTEQAKIEKSFHFVFGVNTIRYCHDSKTEMDNARDIFNLLVPGGICAVIDMNNRFPCFRSDLRNRLRRVKEKECYVPSLEEYTAPFIKTGFEILRAEHFCWVPHSSGKLVCNFFRIVSPLLNAVARSRAMRSLVVARRPQ